MGVYLRRRALGQRVRMAAELRLGAAEVMCRVQREKTWYSAQRGCIL